MIPLRSSLFIVFLILVNSLNAQEWSSRISLMQEHLIEGSNKQINELHVDYLQDQGDVLVIKDKRSSTGINIQFEEDLDTDFLVKDLFVYSLGWSYELGDFSLSFSFENFLNIGQKEFEIQPILDSSYGVVNTVNFSQESLFLVALGISYKF